MGWKLSNKYVIINSLLKWMLKSDIIFVYEGLPMKKTVNLFGKHIMPDCSYCIYGVGDDLECTLHLFVDIDGSCTRFTYDPFRRQPKNEPSVKTFDFKLEDFQI